MLNVEELKEFSREVISKINKGDIISYIEESFSVDFEMNRLKSVENENSFGVGLRVFENNRVGNSFINNMENKDILIKNAIESAALGDYQDFELPSYENRFSVKLFDEDLKSFSKEEAIEIGLKTIKRLEKLDKKARISFHIGKDITTTFLANTSGFSSSYDKSSLSVYITISYVEKNGSILYVSEGNSFSSLKEFSIDEMCDKLTKKYVIARKNVKMRSGYFPVLFSPESLSLLIDPVEIATNGKTLYKGISVFEKKINEKVAAESLTIWDDPLYDLGVESYPFDDEGVSPARLNIIENGVFKNFIFDLFTASKLSRKSTGHGRRSISSLPSPSFSNLFIKPGEYSLDKMISSIDYGLWVFDFLGEGMSNMLAGDFSVNVELGFLIENGVVKGRVKDVMLAGNAFEALNNISMVEDRWYKLRSFYAPSILIDRLSITG